MNGFEAVLEKNTGKIISLEVAIKKLTRQITSPVQRVGVVSVAGEFADAGEVDAAFGAVTGLTARDGDGLIAFVDSGDYLIILVREAGVWAGGKVAGAGVSYS